MGAKLETTTAACKFSLVQHSLHYFLSFALKRGRALFTLFLLQTEQLQCEFCQWEMGLFKFFMIDNLRWVFGNFVTWVLRVSIIF